MTESNNIENEIIEDIEVKQLSLFKRIKYVFTDPTTVMEDIDRKPKVLAPLMIISMVFLALLLMRFNLFKEFTEQQIRLNLANNAQGIEPNDQMLRMSLISGLVGAGIAPLLILSFKSLITHGITQIMDGKGKLKATFSVVVFSYFIQIFGEIIRTIIGLITGEYLITTSFAVFLPNSAMNTPLYSALSSIEVFSIWYLIVSLIGISIVHKMSKGKAAMAVFVPWLIMIGFSVVAVMLQG